jgi:glucose/arabinose dehydrogenase
MFATGLRNAVGLALHPVTGDVWATNNGRDWLGDDLPPETINVVKEGADFGWPRCHAGDLVDPEFGGESGCSGVTAPALKMQAHSAPLGLAFYTGSVFPEPYRGDLFVAFHGSWNRSAPTGYKVVRVHFAADGSPGAPEDFATGFLDADRTMHGRPVGLATGPDGALYISDDKGGYIYRVSYVGP